MTGTPATLSILAAVALLGLSSADPGVFVCDGSAASEGGEGVPWGISQLPDVEHAPAGGLQAHHYPFLVRFDCGLRQETEQPAASDADKPRV